MYTPNPDRYTKMRYRQVGNSGLKLPEISLGFWHNFGYEKPYDQVKEMVLYAFDHGITHFDLANNYGRPDGSAERNLGKILQEELMPFRDEIVISTKAGYFMWDGPYGDGGSRKYLLASLDQSLARMNIPYVDIFYSHRYDPNTPLEETMGALSDAVRSGKALYIGLSTYPVNELRKAIRILKENKTPPLIYQPHFSLLDQGILEDKTVDVCIEEGVGIIPFSIFNQGILTGRYLHSIPEDSRISDPNNPFLSQASLNVSIQDKMKKMDQLAQNKKFSLTNLALNYVLETKGISSALIGVSKLSQLTELLECIENKPVDQSIWADLNQIFVNR